MQTREHPPDPRAPQQAAAIPFRHRDGAVEICLITTARAGRWTVPKGFIDPGATAPETAVKEAREEAGIHGRVVGGPVGYYDITKLGGRYRVAVYLMHVDRVDDAWEEHSVRQRRWTTVRQAEKLLAGRPIEAVFRQALTHIISEEPS
jgi:8-oxo-dGTP pyrophosphatase MutT (NUDIX family)